MEESMMIAKLNKLKHKTELILAVSVAMVAILIIWILCIFPNRQEIESIYYQLTLNQRTVGFNVKM